MFPQVNQEFLRCMVNSLARSIIISDFEKILHIVGTICEFWIFTLVCIPEKMLLES